MWKEEYKEFFDIRLEAINRNNATYYPMNSREEWFNSSCSNKYADTDFLINVLECDDKMKLLVYLKKSNNMSSNKRINGKSVRNWVGITYWAVYYKLGKDKEWLIKGMIDNI
jgi:hypothetical protein